MDEITSAFSTAWNGIPRRRAITGLSTLAAPPPPYSGVPFREFPDEGHELLGAGLKHRSGCLLHARTEPGAEQSQCLAT